MNKKILLGAGGSIAAVKTPEIVRLLVEKGFQTRCVLTGNAARFVSPLALATFSGAPALSEMFSQEAYQMPHLKVVEDIDLMILAPATASLLARCARGLADDLVSLSYLSIRAPVLMAPAMHPSMWEHPATEENVKILRERGVRFVGPVRGSLADGSSGIGHMSEPLDILRAAEMVFSHAAFVSE